MGKRNSKYGLHVDTVDKTLSRRLAEIKIERDWLFNVLHAETYKKTTKSGMEKQVWTPITIL